MGADPRGNWSIETRVFPGVGQLTGSSAQSAEGLTVEQLSMWIANAQIRVSSTEAITLAGGTVVPTPLPGLPHHVTITGLTLAQLHAVFGPPQPNPTNAGGGGNPGGNPP